MGTINYQSLTAVWLNIIKRQSKATSRKAETTCHSCEARLIENNPMRRQSVHSLDGLSDLLTKIR